MKRVTGIGGVFFKAKDQAMMNQWYKEKLGIDMTEWGATFLWNNDPQGSTAFSIFKQESSYYEGPFMINFRVDNLDLLLDTLRKENVKVLDKTEESDYGKFGWVIDPEGNRIELWEPKDDRL